MRPECSIRPAWEGNADATSQVILAAIRETNAKDYPGEVIAWLEKKFSPHAVKDRMAKREVFVAVLGQETVGTASLEGTTIRSVFVAPGVQGRGIGRRLMAEVERAALEAEMATLTVPSSVTAEQSYAKPGFRAVRDSYRGEERTIIMERHLTAA